MSDNALTTDVCSKDWVDMNYREKRKALIKCALEQLNAADINADDKSCVKCAVNTCAGATKDGGRCGLCSYHYALCPDNVAPSEYANNLNIAYSKISAAPLGSAQNNQATVVNTNTGITVASNIVGTPVSPTQQPQPKFTVGDKVNWSKSPKTHIYVVIDINHFSNTCKIGTDLNSLCFTAQTNDLVLVSDTTISQPPEPKFQVGDVVEHTNYKKQYRIVLLPDFRFADTNKYTVEAFRNPSSTMEVSWETLERECVLYSTQPIKRNKPALSVPAHDTDTRDPEQKYANAFDEIKRMLGE